MCYNTSIEMEDGMRIRDSITVKILVSLSVCIIFLLLWESSALPPCTAHGWH